MKLTARSGGSFRLSGAGPTPFTLTEQAGALGVATEAGAARWQLSPTQPAGVVLRSTEDDSELGRSLALPGTPDNDTLRYFLLNDGRLFRMVLRGPRDARFELQGWETAGAYLVARPGADGWTIRLTPAGGGLPDPMPVTLLLVAELLAGDQG